VGDLDVCNRGKTLKGTGTCGSNFETLQLMDTFQGSGTKTSCAENLTYTDMGWYPPMGTSQVKKNKAEILMDRMAQRFNQ